MHVAVLGGGLQGCFVALALADRGVRVSIIDRNHSLMTRTAIANEGKIHLGYMYCADPSLATARMMMRGALEFAPFVARYVGLEPERMPASTPTIYVVHRDSLCPIERISAYFTAVHEAISDAADGRARAYFGIDLRPPPRPWPASECEAEFDRTMTVGAFETPEISIDPVALAGAVAERVTADPQIECLLNRTVLAVEDIHDRPIVVSNGAEGPTRDRYDHVVNALWGGRLAIDATLGFKPHRPWLNRFRYGIRARPRPNRRQPPSVTIVLGAFGEVVNCTDGSLYLMWYPSVLVATSDGLVPPDLPMYPEEPLRSDLLRGTIRGLAGIVTSLRGIEPDEFSSVSIRGGVIVAWGSSDISDPESELHRRFEIGVTSAGRYHSIDPGKLTMTAHFAHVCAGRILEP
jgi:glycine/D-amino acid oxidase-like deaminating enzyme